MAPYIILEITNLNPNPEPNPKKPEKNKKPKKPNPNLNPNPNLLVLPRKIRHCGLEGSACSLALGTEQVVSSISGSKSRNHQEIY